MEEQFKQAFAEIEMLKKRVYELEVKILAKSSLFERREAALEENRRKYEKQNANTPTCPSFGYDKIDGQCYHALF